MRWFSNKKKVQFPENGIFFNGDTALPSFSSQFIGANNDWARTRRGDTKIGSTDMPKKTGFVFYAML